MAFTTFSGPIRSGTVREGAGRNTGLVILAQTVAIPTAAGATTVGILPAGSQIVSINIDTTTLFDAATTITVGTAATANLYVASTTITSAGRASIATTGAYGQWVNVGSSDVTVIATTAGSATAGAGQITITYIQKDSSGNANPTQV